MRFVGSKDPAVARPGLSESEFRTFVVTTLRQIFDEIVAIRKLCEPQDVADPVAKDDYCLWENRAGFNWITECGIHTGYDPETTPVCLGCQRKIKIKTAPERQEPT